MARLIVACPACKARFDVSNFRPGSKIRCGSCYKILKIPDRVGGETSLAEPRTPVPSPPPSPAPAPAPAKKPAAAPPPKPKAEAPPAPAAKAKPASAKKPEPAAAEEEKKPEKKDHDLIGKKVGGEFEIVRLIGEGGYGSVYEAMDLTLKRRVAVKLMLRERTSNPEFVEKFLREARTAAQLSHPNIVKIHHVGLDKDLQQHFLAMEYVEGQTLGDILQKEGKFDLDKAVDVMIQAANGLGEAHRKNIIHRDIKPGNIMITPKGVVKIADFGLAKIYDPDDKASTIIGTPYFMPPEQFEGKARDGRTDIYSLGVTFYYLLTRRRPFDGSTPAQVLLNIMKQEPAPPQQYNPDVPDGISTVLKKMMARDVEQRYSTCEELLRDLKIYREAAESDVKVFCPSCGFGNPFGADKCVECRTSLLEPCPSCGTPDTVGAKFCGNCGANLAQEKEIATILAEAESHVAAGRYEKAIEKYRQAREASPANSRVIEGLRRAEQNQEEREEAVGAIRRLLDTGKPVDALKAAEAASKDFPAHEPISELLGEAKQAAQGVLFDAEVREAEELIASGQLLDACAAARRAIEIEPHSDVARELLSRAEDLMERHGNARDRAEKAEAEHRNADALAAWREALEVVPNDDGARQAVSRLEDLMEQIERHRVRVLEAIEARDLKAARIAVEDAVRLSPDEPGIVEALDRLRVEEKKLEAGIGRALEQAAAGKCQEAARTLGALAEAFPEDESIRTLRDLLSGFVRGADQLLGAARAWLGRHRPETAALYAKVAQRLDPLEGRADALLGTARDDKKAQMTALANVRAMIERGEHDAAVEALAAFGGAASPVAEVADLARRAAAGADRPAVPEPDAFAEAE